MLALKLVIMSNQQYYDFPRICIAFHSAIRLCALKLHVFKLAAIIFFPLTFTDFIGNKKFIGT